MWRRKVVIFFGNSYLGMVSGSLSIVGNIINVSVKFIIDLKYM